MAAGDKSSSRRSLRLFADLVEAEASNCAAYASRPAEASLVRAFSGAATPAEPVGKYLERIYRVGGVDDGTSFVLAGVYLLRFFRSPAAMQARIRVEPTTAHRLAAVALFVGAKFGGHPHRKWTHVFEACSGRAILAREMPALERRFLRAIDYRLYVRAEEFDEFVRIMEAGPATRPPTPAPLPPVADCRGGKTKAPAPVVECREGKTKAPAPPVADCRGEKRKAPAPVADCRGGKRKAAGEEDQRRRVRPCLPTPAIASTN